MSAENVQRLQKLLLILRIAIPLALLALALFALGAFGSPRHALDSTYAIEGMFFSGELGDGRFDGAGKIVFDNGDVYEGSLLEGRFHGRGVYLSVDGWRYEGDFLEGVPRLFPGGIL